MKILVLSEYFPAAADEVATGGVEARGLFLLREVAKRHSVIVLCSFQGPPQQRQERIGGIEICRVGPMHPYSNEGHVQTRFRYAIAALVTGLRLSELDVVEGFSYVTYPIAAVLSRIKRVAAVATIHESWSFKEWVRLKGAFTGSLGAVWLKLGLAFGFHRYIADSKATKQRLVEQGVPASSIDVVYCGVDLQAGQSAIGLQGAPSSICTSARLIPSKRMDLLVRAVSRVRDRLPEVHLTIQGEGIEKPALERLVDELNLRGNVDFVGRLASFEEVQSLRRRSQVFCLPSESEGFGMVVIEAMALGLPVVCTDIPVLREITGGSPGALLFAKDSEEDLAHKLCELLTDNVRYMECSMAARRYAQTFGWAALADEVEVVYEQAFALRGMSGA
jgi:glycosyltransferase involved in cell wall biosynthesis